MIDCIIYEEGYEDKQSIGAETFPYFYFDGLPRVGDILWLAVQNGDSYKEIVCTVVFAAQRASNLLHSVGTGYLVVKIDVGSRGYRT
jgi:hypothetical protein